MSSFLYENQRNSSTLTLLNVLLLKVLKVLSLLSVPMDASMACWALFLGASAGFQLSKLFHWQPFSICVSLFVSLCVSVSIYPSLFLSYFLSLSLFASICLSKQVILADSEHCFLICKKIIHFFREAQCIVSAH